MAQPAIAVIAGMWWAVQGWWITSGVRVIGLEDELFIREMALVTFHVPYSAVESVVYGSRVSERGGGWLATTPI